MMAKNLISWLIVIVGLVSLQTAKAAFPVTDGSRIVHAMKVSAEAKEMLYTMAFAMKPICGKERADWMWSAGPYWASGNRAFDKLRLWQGHGEAISTAFQLGEGEFVFLGDIDKLPWGYAGLKANGKFKFENRVEISNFTDPYMLMLQRKESDISVVNAKDKSFQNNPINSVSVIKNDEKSNINVRVASVCKYGIDVIDSKYQYADSSETLVIVTVPFLESLTKDELVVVLAHELAQVALKLSKNRLMGKTIAKIFLGSLAQAGENQESGLSEPNVDDLIKADYLAMQLASGYGVDVPTYASIIRKLVDRQDSFNAPTYRRTRGILPKRDEALKSSVELWTKSKIFHLVAGVDKELQSEVRSRAKLVNTDPESVFGSTLSAAIKGGDTTIKPVAPVDIKASESTDIGIAKVVSVIPAASDFAKLDDVDSVPLIGAACRERYKTWLTWKLPRGFAISTSGRCGFSRGTKPSQADLPADPAQRALKVCERAGNDACKLYAMDDIVVWKP